jgi:DNA (cytosine-5)-methyltransferase 1
MGYTPAAGLFSAAEIGAPHKRLRIFILAHTNEPASRNGSLQPGWQQRLHLQGGGPGAGHHPPGPGEVAGWATVLSARTDLAPALGFNDCLTWARRLAADPEGPGTAQAEPALSRMADGLAYRARTLRLLGNGAHPLAAAHAWCTLAAAHGLRPMDLAAGRGAGAPSADDPL